MRIKEPLLTEKICSAIENTSADYEKVYKCPYCGRKIYKEELTDKCPDCMMLLSGGEDLILFRERDFGLIAKIMLAIVLIEYFMPFALLGFCQELDDRLSIYFFVIWMSTFDFWTLWINPLYLSYIQIDDNIFMRRDLAGSKRRCAVFFILHGFVFLGLSQIFRIERRVLLLSLGELLIAFIISYANIVFPHITRYESIFKKYVLWLPVKELYPYQNAKRAILPVICIGLSITLIAYIIRRCLL